MREQREDSWEYDLGDQLNAKLRPRLCTLPEEEDFYGEDWDRTLTKKDIQRLDAEESEFFDGFEGLDERKQLDEADDSISDLEEGFASLQFFDKAASPRRDNNFFKLEKPTTVESLNLSSPSRSTSSMLSQSGKMSETETECTQFNTDGLELEHDLPLLKKFHLQRERAQELAREEHQLMILNNQRKSLKQKINAKKSSADMKAWTVPDMESDSTQDLDTFIQNLDDPDIFVDNSRRIHGSLVINGKKDDHRQRNLRSKVSMPVVSGGHRPSSLKRYSSAMNLDSVNTLTSKDKQSLKKLLNLANYMEVSSPKKSYKKPKLIKQLKTPKTEKIYHNKLNNSKMRYNPETLRWEGNEMDLSRFDSIKLNQPKLISKNAAKPSKEKRHIVGKMLFDPEKLCWVSMDPEDDPFQDIDSLEESRKVPKPLRMRPSSKFARGPSTTSTIMTSTTTSSYGDTQEAEEEFDLSADKVEKFRHEDDKWTRKVKNWFPYADEPVDYSFMYEIRRMVKKR